MYCQIKEVNEVDIEILFPFHKVCAESLILKLQEGAVMTKYGKIFLNNSFRHLHIIIYRFKGRFLFTIKTEIEFTIIL